MKLLRVICLLGLLILGGPQLKAQKILLPSGILTFSPLQEGMVDEKLLKAISFNNRFYFAAYFSVLPNTKLLESFAGRQVKISGRLAPNTYLIESPEAPTAGFCRAAGIYGIAAIPAQLKLDDRIISRTIPSFAFASKEVVKISIGILGSIPIDKLTGVLKEKGFTITTDKWAAKGVLEGTSDLQNITAIASLPFVYAIRLTRAEDKLLNSIGRGTSGTALLQLPVALGGRNLKGKGVTVGIGDDSDPSLHPDVMDRIINHSAGITNNHGAHVTGTVGGAGILTYRHAGFAPEASLLSQWFSGVWENAATYTTAYNMVVTNNSYGNITGDCSYAGVYDLSSYLLDVQAFDFPQLLHAFASGNDGDNTCAPFPQAYQTVLGGYQSAKNIITVGRTDYTQVSSSSSSSGPVRDGRLKPEITGMGIITSLNGAGNGYYTEFGTSMSAPNITGGLALLYQRYRELYGNNNPPGALMKALLLNGARDVGTKGPDFRHGYGTMMLERSLRMLENKKFSIRSIAQGQVQDTIIQVAAGGGPLKIMVYWHDPAANVLASNTLVHDLDLEVIDPANNVIKPLVLNPQAGNVKDAALPGEDHSNNHEQVVIDNPLPGNYTIRVKGTEILSMPQQAYAITFDQITPELRFTNPLKGSVAAAGTIYLPIAWEDELGTAGNYNLSYSLDNGSNWTDIVSDLKDTTRLVLWQPGNIRSTEARLKIVKGSTTTISEKFAIIPNISFSAAATGDQCQGYFRINWTALTAAPGETISYVIKRKKGSTMEPIDTVDAPQTAYVMNNLSPDSVYYAAVTALINGVEGVYATAVSRKPNTGNCNGTISDNDLMVDSILSPLSGRQFTSTALNNAATVSIRIRNLDNAVSGSFQVKYSINGGPFTEATVNTPIAARGTMVQNFTGVDFSGIGQYTLTAVVTRIGGSDPNPANDTLRATFSHLPNPPINLATPFVEDFETASSFTALRSQTGLAGLSRWDYVNADPLARARTAAFPGIARSGSRAISLDVSKSAPRVTNPFNQLIGTFNLAGYNANTDEIRLSFYYKHHGSQQKVQENNKVWVRGSDNDGWLELFDLGAAQTTRAGEWQKITALELNRVLTAGGQQFSASTQIRFGQYGLVSMADNEHFSGYTFDDVSLFIAVNDLQIIEILQPGINGCGTATGVSVKVKVKNGNNVALNNVSIRYKLNGNAWVEEIISAINAREVLEYSFTTPLTIPASGKITLEAEVLQPGDNIPENNKKQLQLIYLPVVNSFPYYEDFEGGNGGFVSDGLNNSWQFGKPSSLGINKAASGQNAWKTTLTGNYNNEEISYLYSPCFNISGLANPMLGFSLAYSIEDCRSSNIICDAAWMEYSLDGLTWQKLGSFGQGEGWYDYESGQVWMSENETNWREAIIPLPVTNGTIRLRYVFASDEGATREGIAIDNFHVYNGGALPLGWLSFDAMATPDNKVELNWRVANALPGELFEVQVATDPNAPNGFIPAGLVTVTNLPANRFSFTDQNPAKAGMLFYRIGWTQQNGNLLFSPVKKVMLQGIPAGLTVYPNPASQKLLVRAKASGTNSTIRLMTADGKTIYTAIIPQANGQVNHTIDLLPLKLSPGIYFLELLQAEGRQTIRWIKQ